MLQLQFCMLCQNSSSSPCPTSVFLMHTMSSSTSSPLIFSQAFSSSQWSSFLCLPLSANTVQAQNAPSTKSSRHGQSLWNFASLALVKNQTWKPRSKSRDSQQQRSLRLLAKANDSMADDSLPSEMSLKNAMRLLGVREGASFEEILTAKKTMVDSCNGDQAHITQVICLIQGLHFCFGLIMPSFVCSVSKHSAKSTQQTVCNKGILPVTTL